MYAFLFNYEKLYDFFSINSTEVQRTSKILRQKLSVNAKKIVKLLAIPGETYLKCEDVFNFIPKLFAENRKLSFSFSL